jgi:beta-lactamase class A
MLAAADLQRLSGTFWTEFWDFLWNSENNPEPIPLDSTFSETLLREYLTNEISSRYDLLPTAAKPLPGQLIYQPGIPGTTLNIESNIIQIEYALHSPGNRTLNISLEKIAAPPPSFENLEILLKQTIDLAEFDGVAGVYVMDLLTGSEIHFILDNGIEVSTNPDLAFTASSTIKIPIMISAFRHLGDSPDSEALNLLNKMITESGNDPADWLMQQFIDDNYGPLEVTADMQSLGLENTFLAGYFYDGAVLLYLYETPANSRTDVSISRDIYNQSTLSDMGQLLADLYMCEQNRGGGLVAVFPDEITQNECRLMIDLLTRNNTPYLIESGSPEGTRIAHKHGWSSDFTTAIRTISDAGIVYTPNRDYVVVFNFYHPVQLVWGPSSELIGNLAKVIYNYFNLSN